MSKLMARAGLCSRRTADQWIEAGRVQINGAQACLGQKVRDDGKDSIVVDGSEIKLRPGVFGDRSSSSISSMSGDKKHSRLWLVHKLKGELVSDSDPEGRPTVMERLRTMGLYDSQHLSPVGRLDYNTEGLLLVTNDGQLARQMELPKNKLVRKYRARVHGQVTESMLKALGRGVSVQQNNKMVRYRPIMARVSQDFGNFDDFEETGGYGYCWLSLLLTEGKNLEIKNALGSN